MSWTDHVLRPLRSTLKHNCFCTSGIPGKPSKRPDKWPIPSKKHRNPLCFDGFPPTLDHFSSIAAETKQMAPLGDHTSLETLRFPMVLSTGAENGKGTFAFSHVYGGFEGFCWNVKKTGDFLRYTHTDTQTEKLSGWARPLIAGRGFKKYPVHTGEPAPPFTPIYESCHVLAVS